MRWLRTLLAALILPISTVGFAEELRVSIPPALNEEISELSQLFRIKNPGWQVFLDPALPEEAERRVQVGAPIDVFIGNDPEVWNRLDEQQLLSKAALVPLIANDLCVVVSAEKEMNVSDLKDLIFPELKKVALLPEGSIVGNESRRYLKNTGIWDAVSEKISDARSSRVAVEQVKKGEADWAVVMRSDIAGKGAVKAVWNIPPEEASGLLYSAAVLPGSEHPEEAKLFVESLQSVIASKIFGNAGYRSITILAGPDADEKQTQTAETRRKKERKPDDGKPKEKKKEEDVPEKPE